MSAKRNTDSNNFLSRLLAAVFNNLFSLLIFIDEIKSVYVRNLPPNVDPSEVEEEFVNFGKLKQTEGVVIRSCKVHFLAHFSLVLFTYVTLLS